MPHGGKGGAVPDRRWTSEAVQSAIAAPRGVRMNRPMTMILRDPVGQAAAPATLAGFVSRRAEEPLAHQLLRPLFPRDREALLLAGFDAYERLVRIEWVEGDDSGRCAIPPSCWRSLANDNVSAALMAHNHPSGTAAPSDADLHSTQEAVCILRAMAIDLLDHLIFVDIGHFSFRRAGLL